MIYLKEGGNPFDWVKEKKLLALLGATILCLGICFLHYKSLCAKVGFDGVMTSNGFIEPTVLFKQSGETMGDVLKLFGIPGNNHCQQSDYDNDNRIEYLCLCDAGIFCYNVCDSSAFDSYIL